MAQDPINVDDPAWPTIQAWLEKATHSVEVLPPDEQHRREALIESRVTLRSPMGAIAYNTGGLLIDHGWLRFLGSGHPKLTRSAPGWNRDRSGKFWLIADDVVGGFFALDGGEFNGTNGQVHYFAPDSLNWEPMSGLGYSQFLAWSLSPGLGDFYRSLRWPGWEDEVSTVHGDQALSFYPFLWTKEGKVPSECSRRPCPIDEIYELHVSKRGAQ